MERRRLPGALVTCLGAFLSMVAINAQGGTGLGGGEISSDRPCAPSVEAAQADAFGVLRRPQQSGDAVDPGGGAPFGANGDLARAVSTPEGTVRSQSRAMAGSVCAPRIASGLRLDLRSQRTGHRDRPPAHLEGPGGRFSVHGLWRGSRSDRWSGASIGRCRGSAGDLAECLRQPREGTGIGHAFQRAGTGHCECAVSNFDAVAIETTAEGSSSPAPGGWQRGAAVCSRRDVRAASAGRRVVIYRGPGGGLLGFFIPELRIGQDLRS